MRKQWVASLVAGVLTVSLVGCGGAAGNKNSGGTSNVAPAPAKKEPVTLKFMRPGTVDVVHKVFEPIIQKFMAENQDIKVEFVDMGWGEYDQRLATMVATKTAPDVQLVSQGTLYNLASQGAYLPLDNLLDADLKGQVSPALWDAATFDKKIYEVPASVGGYILWYNADLFKQAGLDPAKPPTTFDEVVTYAKQIKEKTGVPGVGINAKAFVDIVDLYASFYQSQSGKPLLNPDTKTFNFDSAEGREALQVMLDLVYKHKVTQPNVEEYTRADLRPLFRDGKVAMLFDGPWIVNMLQAKSDLADLTKTFVRTAPFPAGKGGSKPFFGADGWAISANTKNPEAAWKFLRYLSTPENQYAHDIGYGGVPVQKQERAMDAFKPAYWQTLAGALDNGYSRMKSPQFTALTQVVQDSVQKAMVNAATPDAAIKEAVEAAKKVK